MLVWQQCFAFLELICIIRTFSEMLTENVVSKQGHSESYMLFQMRFFSAEYDSIGLPKIFLLVRVVGKEIGVYCCTSECNACIFSFLGWKNK